MCSFSLQAEANLLGFDEKKWDSQDFTGITAEWGGVYDQVIRGFGFTGGGVHWSEGGTLWPIRKTQEQGAPSTRSGSKASEAASGKEGGEANDKASGGEQGEEEGSSRELRRGEGRRGNQAKKSRGGGGGNRTRGGAFPLEPLGEFERFMGLDVFPLVQHVHLSTRQLIGKYMRDWHTLDENALKWPGPYTPFENTTRSLAPKDYYTDGSSCAIDAFNLAIGKVCSS